MGLKQLYSDLSVNLGAALNNLADTDSIVIEIDNSINRHLSDDFDIECAGAGTGTVDIYRAGSNTAGNFAANTDIDDVWDLVKRLPMSATKKKIDFRLEPLKSYNALRIVNNSGEQLAGTGNSVYRKGADIENV